MTVQLDTCVTLPMQGTGLVDSWPFEFLVKEASDITFIVRNRATLDEVIIDPDAYEVPDIALNNDEGGSVTYPLSGDLLSDEYEVIIARNSPYEQDTALGGNQGGFPPRVIEAILDKIVLMVQQNRRDIGQAMKLPYGVSVAGGQWLLTTDDGYVVGGGAATDFDDIMADAAQVAEDAAAVAAALAEVTAMLDQITDLLGGLTDPVIQSFTVDETTTSVTISTADPIFSFVFNEGVFLTAGVDYTISGTTLTPTTAFTPERLTVLAMAAVTLPITMLNLKRYVCVSDYCPTNDSLSSVAGEQAAHNAAYGRELVYDNPYGDVRYYRGTARGNGRITTQKKVRIIGAPGAIIDRSAYGTSGAQSRYFQTYAEFDTATRAITGPVVRGDETLTFVTEAHAAAYAKFGYGILGSDDLLTGSATDYRSEYFCVVGRTGAVVQLAYPVRDDYVTLPRALRVIEGCEVQYEDMQLIGAGKNVDDAVSGDRGIWIGHGLNSGVDGGYVYGAQMQSIALDSVINGYVRNVEITLDQSAFAGAQYPVAIINNCENVSVELNRISNGREGVALTDTGMPTAFGFATGGGIPRDITIMRNEIFNQHRSGVTTHWAGRGLRIAYNAIKFCEQGADIRIRGNTEVDHNTIEDTGTHAGNLHMAMQLSANAADVTFAYNTVKRAGRGVVMPADEVHIAAPGNFKIFNNLFEDMERAAGSGIVEIHNTTASTSECGAVVVHGNVAKGTGSGGFVGVEVEGNWEVSIGDNEYRNCLTGSRSAYLHATANGTGANGPRNVVMRNDSYDANFADPVYIHQGAGTPLIEGNGPIAATSLSVYTLNSGGGISLPLVRAIKIAARTGTTDDLDSIPIQAAGCTLDIFPDAGDTITFRHIGGGTGNLRAKSGANFTLVGTRLVSDGVNWNEV